MLVECSGGVSSRCRGRRELAAAGALGRRRIERIRTVPTPDLQRLIAGHGSHG